MANYCGYTMRAKGTKDAVDELVDIMQYKHKLWWFRRIFSADVYEVEDSGDNVIVGICGDCAWSVLVCMTDAAGSYISEAQSSKFVSLRKVSELLHLEIEVWSEEPGIGFQEHFHYDNGTELANECFDDYVSAYYDEDEYESFEDFAMDVGHPECTIEDLDKEGWLEIRAKDPVFSF